MAKQVKKAHLAPASLSSEPGEFAALINRWHPWFACRQDSQPRFLMIKLSERCNKLFNWERERGEKVIMLGLLVFDSPNDMLARHLFNRIITSGYSRCWLNAWGQMQEHPMHTEYSRDVRQTLQSEGTVLSAAALTVIPQSSFSSRLPVLSLTNPTESALP